MNGPPGHSIFDGGEFIAVNNSGTQNAEEAEALEDQRRLQDELQNELQYAFEDLESDSEDNNTVNESNNSIFGEKKSFGQRKPTNVPVNNNFNQPTQSPMVGNSLKSREHELGSLRNQLESKTREFDHVSGLLADERKSAESQINELKKRLALSEAERDRVTVTRQQTHELLVEAKSRISDQDDALEKLRTKNRSLENANSELQGQLESAKTMVSDLQQKYHMVERNIGVTNDKNADALVKATNERFSGKIDMMQQQIESLRNKYDGKVAEVKSLEIRYLELQRSREGMLIEKSETINQLAQSLEESQRQCQKLMEKPDLTPETIRLERLSAALESQTIDMQSTIDTLTRRLDQTQAELDAMDSVLTDADLSLSVRRLSLSSRQKSSQTTPENRLTKLKAELYRCVDGLKTKRDEIKKLERQLEEKNDEIRIVRGDVIKLTTEMTMARARTVELERQLEAVDYSSNRAAFKELTTKNNDLLTTHTELSQELETAKSRMKSLEKLIEISEAKYNDLRKLNDREKEAIESLKKLAADEQKKSNEKKQLDELTTAYRSEIGELKEQILRQTTQIDDLNTKLDLKSERDNLLDDLKQKAQQFEELLQSSARKSQEKTKPKSRDQSVSTSPDLEQSSSRETEKRLRNEFARSFALQLKSIESQNLTKVQQYEKGVTLLKSELGVMCEKYEKKTSEFNVLKSVILAERENSKELLQKKDAELKRFLTEYHQVLEKFQQQINTAEKRVNILINFHYLKNLSSFPFRKSIH